MHYIKTKLTAKQLMKLNPSIKSEADAKRILKQVRTTPAYSLDEVVAMTVEARQSDNERDNNEKRQARDSRVQHE